jgi:PAS domain-containing protein
MAERRIAANSAMPVSGFTEPVPRVDPENILLSLAGNRAGLLLSRTGQIVAVNDHAARLFGRSPDSLRGIRFGEWAASSATSDLTIVRGKGKTTPVRASRQAAQEGEQFSLVLLEEVAAQPVVALNSLFGEVIGQILAEAAETISIRCAPLPAHPVRAELRVAALDLFRILAGLAQGRSTIEVVQDSDVPGGIVMKTLTTSSVLAPDPFEQAFQAFQLLQSIGCRFRLDIDGDLVAFHISNP